jgi:Fic family protein
MAGTRQLWPLSDATAPPPHSHSGSWRATQDLLRLFETDGHRIQDLGRAAGSAGMVHGVLQRRAIVTIQKAAQELSLSEPTIASALGHLISIGIVREVTGKQRHRVFAYQAYLDRLAEGTEPRRL